MLKIVLKFLNTIVGIIVEGMEIMVLILAIKLNIFLFISGGLISLKPLLIFLLNCLLIGGIIKDLVYEIDKSLIVSLIKWTKKVEE